MYLMQKGIMANPPVRRDLQSRRSEYKHLQCETINPDRSFFFANPLAVSGIMFTFAGEITRKKIQLWIQLETLWRLQTLR